MRPLISKSDSVPSTYDCVWRNGEALIIHADTLSISNQNSAYCHLKEVTSSLLECSGKRQVADQLTALVQFQAELVSSARSSSRVGLIMGALQDTERLAYGRRQGDAVQITPLTITPF